jgi:mRNA interferase RelE/StbE
MGKYTIVLTKRARKELDKLSDKIAEPILEAIGNLSDNPRPHGFKKLKGRTGYRIRVGDYRIIYDVFDSELIIDVINLGHRKDIYES